MTAVLKHPIGPHTVDEWLDADHPTDGGRLELIWGYFHVSPPPGGPHQYATGALYRALWSAVQARGRDDLYPVIGVGVEITTALRTALIPDVALLNTAPMSVSFAPESLELAVEVWSPANSRRERETKLAAYAAAGVPYLWLVDYPAGQPVFQGMRLVGGAYREVVRAGDGLIHAPGPILVPLDVSTFSPR